MATLGVNYRIVYESKGFRSGLTGVIALIVKPDLTIIGPLSLAEFSTPGFSGVYYADLPTMPGDVEGDWICRIYSPEESHWATKRISYLARLGESSGGSSSGPAISGHIITKTLRGAIARRELKGVISNEDIDGTLGLFGQSAGGASDIVDGGLF